MAEHGLATISVLTPHHRLRPRAADLSHPWNTTQASPISATHIGKRIAGKLHEPLERAGGGRATSPTLQRRRPCNGAGAKGSGQAVVRSKQLATGGRRCVRQANRSTSRRSECTKPIKRSNPKVLQRAWMARQSNSSKPT